MAKFDVASKYVTIDKEEYKLLPLDGNMLPKIYKIIGDFDPATLKQSNPEEAIKRIKEDTAQAVYDVVFSTMKKSYPQEEDSKLADFVTVNLWTLFTPIMQLNMGAKE